MGQLLSNCQPTVIVVALFSAGVIAAGATSPVGVCQVVGRSGEFDNQLISVRGVLMTSEEGGWMLPASPCPNPVVDGKTMHNAILVWTGNSSPKLFKYRVPLNTNDESMWALWNQEQVCQKKQKGLLVVLHGRFEGYPFFKIASKGKVVNYGFGSDLNFTGQIVAERAEKIFGCVEEPH
jgi:hypothetical protein